MDDDEARRLVEAARDHGRPVNRRQFKRAVGALIAGDHAAARDALRRLGATGCGTNTVLLADRGAAGQRLCGLAIRAHYFRDPEAVAQLRAAGLAVDPDGAIRPVSN